MEHYINELKQRYPLKRAEYFLTLTEGTFDRQDFIETQIQFLFAVVHFSRPMSVIASRLPRPEIRINTLKNVMEEHGNGLLSNSHESTFLSFLDAMGVSSDYIEQRALWPEVKSFNSTLSDVCLSGDLYTAVATIGIIEDLFSHISSYLGQAIVGRNWLKSSELIHYHCHKDLDEEHADEFYQIIRPFYGKGDHRSDYLIEQGLELGAYIFMTMYQELYRSRTRRWIRQVSGPHSLTDGWYLNTDRARPDG